MAVTVTVVTKIKISLDIQKSPTYPIHIMVSDAPKVRVSSGVFMAFVTY